jgi:putative tricarboxylic transport membrane protein
MVGRGTVAAAALLVFAAVAAFESARLLPFGVVRNPGPGFFPWWLSLALGLLALGLLVQARLGPWAPRLAGARGPGLARVAGVLAVLALYSMALEGLGYPIATFLVVLFMLRVTEPHRWPLALALAVLAAGGSYLVFAVWLDVPLPAGLLAR